MPLEHTLRRRVPHEKLNWRAREEKQTNKQHQTWKKVCRELDQETRRKKPRKVNVDTNKKEKVGSLTLQKSITAASNGVKRARGKQWLKPKSGSRLIIKAEKKTFHQKTRPSRRLYAQKVVCLDMSLWLGKHIETTHAEDTTTLLCAGSDGSTHTTRRRTNRSLSKALFNRAWSGF
jgi:hypothetical protein